MPNSVITAAVRDFVTVEESVQQFTDEHQRRDDNDGDRYERADMPAP